MSEMEVPEGWKTKTFEDIVKNEKYTIKRGPWGSTIKKDFFVPDGYKVYQQHNVIYDDFNYGDYFLDEKKFEELKEFEIKSGDFLISCSGTIGKIARVPSNAKKGVMNQALLKISIDESKIDSDFFLYFLKSPILQQKILSKGSAMKNIVSVSDLKKIEFFIPEDIKIQRKIFLKLNIILEQLEQKKKEIFSLKNYEKLKNSDVLLRQKIYDDVFSNITNNWNKKSLGDVTIRSQNGKTGRPNNQPPGTPRLGISCITQNVTGFVDESKCKFQNITKSDIDNYQIECGDLLVCRQNGNKNFVGKFSVYSGNTRPLIFSDSLVRFQIKTDEVLPEFLMMFMSSTSGRKKINPFCKTTAGNYSVNSTNLKTIEFSFPSIPEQEKLIKFKNSSLQIIEDTSNHITEFLNVKEKTLSLIKNLEMSILKIAFSGKLVN